MKAYKTITDRIDLKQKINDNLVAIGTASIQKNVGRGALINMTEAEMERLTFPKDFKVENVSEFCIETKSGSTPSRTTKEYWKTEQFLGSSLVKYIIISLCRQKNISHR